jgi:UDP-N-acetyl-D-glucosamine/UDP-N-acetyl-D-galactosamine dehydrogenase
MTLSSFPVLSVTGLGYVGLPVACAFAAKGFAVVGYDHDAAYIGRLQGHETIAGVRAEERRALTLTHNGQARAAATFHLVTVPTPVNEVRKPDLTLLHEACVSLAACLKTGDTVVFESTVYPGATEEICLPLLEKHAGLRMGEDVAIGYSPERINPGDTLHRLETVTKIVAGLTPAMTDSIAAVYQTILQTPVYKAPSIKVAEAAKVLENTQRDVNIALMNEVAVIFGRLGIDTQDVITAAASKWNFHPYWPGLVGGHCIGVDPYYLVYKAETTGYTPDVMMAARRMNNEMGEYTARQVLKYLLQKRVQYPTVLVLGLTFKEDLDDVRNTRVVEVKRALEESGVSVLVHDPLASPALVQQHLGFALVEEAAIPVVDAVVLAVPHQPYRLGGWGFIKRFLPGGSGFVADIKGILPREDTPPGVTLWRL